MSQRFEPRRRATPRAFTLIEVLVVVAIIALLVAILLPSLQRARIHAQLVTCAANAKTISHNILYYQGDFKDYVPIMRNWHATHHYLHSGKHVPAEQSYISLALRRYEPGLANLANIRANQVSSLDVSEYFNPLEPWSTIKRDDYEARLMPEHYTCPFERGRDPWERGSVGVQIYPTAVFNLMVWTGVMDSYHTWYHEGQIWRGQPASRAKQPNGPFEPSGWGGSPNNGIAQYSVLTWNSKDAPWYDIEKFRRWGNDDVVRERGGTLGEMTIIYCALGEHVEYFQHWFNRGSHPTSRGGGTNAVFADLSVRWVKGTRIGWP